MRASPNCLSHSRCAATSAWRRHTTDSRSFLPKPAEKLDILMVFEFRVNSGAVKIACVATAIGGTSTTYHACGNSSGASRSPMPSAKAFPPKRKNGTSAPSVSAIATSLAFGRASPHRRFRTASVVSQSEPPPPRPPPIGMVFSTPMSTPRFEPPSARSNPPAPTARASPPADRDVLLDLDVDALVRAALGLEQPRRAHGEVFTLGDAGQGPRAPHLGVGARREAQPVAAFDQAESGLQQVIAVWTPADDVKEEIELGRGRIAALPRFQSVH